MSYSGKVAIHSSPASVWCVAMATLFEYIPKVMLRCQPHTSARWVSSSLSSSCLAPYTLGPSGQWTLILLRGVWKHIFSCIIFFDLNIWLALLHHLDRIMVIKYSPPFCFVFPSFNQNVLSEKLTTIDLGGALNKGLLASLHLAT